MANDPLGQNIANHPSDAWQIQALNAFQMFAPMLGLSGRTPNMAAPLGMSQIQMGQQLIQQQARNQMYSTWTQATYDSAFGAGSFGKLGNFTQQAVGVGAQFLSMADNELFRTGMRLTAGYDPFKMMNIAEAQRTVFLRQNEFLGAGTVQEQNARQMRLYESAATSWQDAARVHKTVRGKAALGNVWLNEPEDAFQFTTMLERGGVRGLFNSAGKVNEDTYNQWVGTGASIGNAMQTKDVTKIYDTLKRATGGIRGELDPERMRKTFDDISKMAHYLDVSAEMMTKTVLDIQDTIKNNTGTHISAGGAAKIVATSVTQAKLAGFSPERAMEQVGWDVEQESMARNSRAGRMLTVMMDPTSGLTKGEKDSLTGMSAKQVDTMFKRLRLDENLLDNDVYLKSVQERMSGDDIAYLDNARDVNRRSEYSLRASNAATAYSFNMAGRHAMRSGRGNDINKAKLDAMKEILASGSIDVSTADFVRAKISEMEAGGASAAQTLAKAVQLTGFTGDELTKLNTDIEAGATPKLASSMAKYGAFDNTVSALRAKGSFKLDAKEINRLRELSVQDPNGAFAALQQASVFAGEKGASAFNRVRSDATRAAQSELEQAGQGQAYRNVIKKYGGDAGATKAYFASLNLNATAAGLSESDSLDYEQRAKLEQNLKEMGLYSSDQINSIMRGDTAEMKEGILSVLGPAQKGLDIYGKMSGVAGLGLSGDAARLNVSKNLTEGQAGPNVENRQALTPADVLKTLATTIGELVGGLTTFSGAIEKAIDRLFPKDGQAVKEVKQVEEWRKSGMGTMEGANEYLVRIKGDLKLGGTTVANLEEDTVCNVGKWGPRL